MLQRTSYGPTGRAMIRICKEESHQRQGYEIMTRPAWNRERKKWRRMHSTAGGIPHWWCLVRPTAKAQTAITPSNGVSNAKRTINCVSGFVNQTVVQAEYLGLSIPDKTWRGTKAKRLHYSDPDWAEFKNVIKGNGICNKDRLTARNKAHHNGAQVREAAAAYAKKRNAGKCSVITQHNVYYLTSNI